MSDVALKLGSQGLDLVIEDGDLVQDRGLSTDVVLSLWSDARARPDDSIPDGTQDRRGWWGQDGLGDVWGSRWWIARRSKVIPQTLVLMREAAAEALQWLVAEGLAEEVNVESLRMSADSVLVRLEIRRGGAIQNAAAWEATELLELDTISVQLALA